jgi:probable phosphoglycerate mutase
MLDVRVYIVRHGETTENRMGIIQGQLDTELNDEGKRQAQVTALALKNEAFNLAFSSDSHRAMDVCSVPLHPLI